MVKPSKLWHVQIFENDSKNKNFIYEENKHEIKFPEHLLPFGPKSVFLSPL